MRFWSVFGGPLARGRHLATIVRQKSNKWHPERHTKIDAEKVMSNDEKRLQNDTKMDVVFYVFHTFSKKAKSHETIVFTIENVVLGMQKRINNLSTIDAKSMLEKGMQQI